MHAQTRKRIASILADVSPFEGPLETELSSAEITEILWEEGQEVEQETVERILRELAALGFIWLSISNGPAPRVSVSAVFFPYGLSLIA